MAKRKTVNIICNKVIPLIEENEWSNAAFSRKVGKYSSWFGEVLRGNNLPSPEEAAQMCLLLNTTPEEILLGVGETEKDTAELQADIALVRGLIEQEREKQGIKKTPGFSTEGWTDLQKEGVEFLLSLPPKKLALFLKMGRAGFEDDEND